MTDAAWIAEPYLASSEDPTVDGGFTSKGPLWHAVSPRWGHSMHPMCSYHGMFPARLVHYFLQTYTQPGDLVLDPFAGRGTTVLQARVEGRRAVGNDLNPLAFVLTGAKAEPPPFARFMQYLSDLEEGFKSASLPEADVPDDIRMLFHPHTLDQLLYLRRRLAAKTWSKWTASDFLLAGAVAGILHGSYRADGTSAYLSISMPNTFSMSPAYVRRYISEKQLKPLRHSVFERLRDKIARLYLDDPVGENATAHRSDAVRLLASDKKRIPSGTVDLLLTSPPYLRVVNYGTSNWIRLWWLGIEDVGRQKGQGRARLDAQLDHGHNYASYRDFMERVLRATARVLRPDGVAVFVIGDVAEPDKPALRLALEVWEDVGRSTGLRLVDSIEDSIAVHSKVSRIWGDTRGQATEVERILVLGRSKGRPRDPLVDEVDWEEPYRDAGPDAAHDRARR